jgi:hypothetical protein
MQADWGFPLQAEDPKRETGAAGEVAMGFGGAVEAEEPHHGDGEIAQDRNHPGSGAGTDLGAILVVAHIADPVAWVFDGPVATDQWTCLVFSCTTRYHDVTRLRPQRSTSSARNTQKRL